MSSNVKSIGAISWQLVEPNIERGQEMRWSKRILLKPLLSQVTVCMAKAVPTDEQHENFTLSGVVVDRLY